MADFLTLIQQNPKVSIILIGTAISFFISLVNYFFLDKEKLRDIKARQKELQKEMKQHQKDGNHEKVMALNKELMPMMGQMMKHSMKPMLITIIPIIILFSFIKNVYVDTAIASSWFWYYLVAAIASSMIFRKILKLP